MRTALAVATGFIVWLAIFLLGQAIGFSLWGLSPGSKASQGLVAFLSSLIGAIAAELVMKKIAPNHTVKAMYWPLAALVALTLATVLWFGHAPQDGIALPLVVLVCALVPMIQGLVAKR